MKRKFILPFPAVPIILLGITVIVLGILLYVQWANTNTAIRQAIVREKGQDVMPFDLNKTTHIFQPLDDGGLQQVVVKDRTDRADIDLIREHLQKEAKNFQKGDFTDPAFIHGMDMAGLSDMSTNSLNITVLYRSIVNGAEIRYTSKDPHLISAIHDWFHAQAMDHGHDAMMR